MPSGRGRRPSPRRANPVAQPAHRGNRRRVAVIDDDELVCQNAKDKISNFEYIDLALMLRSNFNQRLSRACIVHLVIKKNNWSM